MVSHAVRKRSETLDYLAAKDSVSPLLITQHLSPIG